MAAQDAEILLLKNRLAVFDGLQEEYWLNQSSMEKRADQIYAHQSEYEEKTMVELKSLNEKVTWSNEMIHEDCLNIHLQQKRINCLVAFKDHAVVQLKDAPTQAWCKNEVESWKDWSNELGSHVDLISSRLWDAEQRLMIHNHCHHCPADYNSPEVSGWEPTRFRTRGDTPWPGSDRSHSSFGTPEGVRPAPDSPVIPPERTQDEEVVPDSEGSVSSEESAVPEADVGAATSPPLPVVHGVIRCSWELVPTIPYSQSRRKKIGPPHPKGE